MDDYGIKPEWAEAWQETDIHCPSGSHSYTRYLDDLSAHLLAGWMRERFEREHRQTRYGCIGCVRASSDYITLDPRHNYDDAAWLQAAREKLGGEK